MDVEKIIPIADLIVKYGFLAVGLVLTLVIAPFMNKFWEARTLTITVASFGVAFVVAWGVLDIVQRFFPALISSSDSVLAGVVLEVPNGYRAEVESDLRTTAGSAYLRREKDRHDRPLFHFPFVLVGTQSPTCIAVVVVNNDPNAETGQSGFKIAPISKDDFKPNAAVVAKAKPDGNNFRLLVWREAGGRQVNKPVELNPLASDDPGCTVGQSVGFWEWAFPSAFAQSNIAKVQEFSLRLKSDDVFTRRNARIDLSKQGTQTAEIAKQLLNSEEYRLQLGALVALSIMPEQELKQLPPDVLQKVRGFTNSRDPTINETAKRIEAQVAPR